MLGVAAVVWVPPRGNSKCSVAAGTIASTLMNDEMSPLVSVEELIALVDGDTPPVIVDLRWYLGRPDAGHEAYLEGHIPGAIFLDLDADLADPQGLGAPGRHPLPDPRVFAARMAAVGIGDGTRVIGYDDGGGWVAARLWWMLDDLGFGRRGIPGEGAGVLDGGIKAWVDAGQALSAETRTGTPNERGLHLAEHWQRVIEREDLKRRLGSVTLLDARAPERYRGEVEPVDPVAGHIPTAFSAPYGASLESSGRVKDAAGLRASYAELGITASGEGEVVVSCGSGTSATHHSLAMRVAGLPDPILYVGSYSDWSRSGEPVATGPEPGPAPDNQ